MKQFTKPIQSAWRITAAVLTTGVLLVAAHFVAPVLAPVTAKIGSGFTFNDAQALTYFASWAASLYCSSRAAKAGRPISAFTQAAIPGFVGSLMGAPSFALLPLHLVGLGAGLLMGSYGYRFRAKALDHATPT